ncbi:putative Tetraacyldisaccharide 4'-kinase [Candidatus Sulfobium mesophilum]|uniref:Tetraacyldisaccharide 4'-kinase n=1 Tax=Candidatus Sulfobium mesophilum TaxID=2016548 RepID=A0A2U3QI72_9BACT|nr:putative Tetraacyldisaccharide 4'-kinase [Candidatus Sulfobium mesophilum]
MHLLESLYYLGFSARQYYSLMRQKRLPCRVISIGNITVGGTGKTPATIAVAEEAQRRGLKPVILTRGYKGRAKGPCFVTKGEAPLLSVRDAGDEPVLMSERLKGVPIIKGSSRFEAGMFALRKLQIREAEFKSYVFILDDGFQHRGLYRDRDIVLIDYQNPFADNLLLPLGRLREPVKSLRRTDVIVMTRAGGNISRDDGANNEVLKVIRHYSPQSALFFANHTPVSCVLRSGEGKPAGWLTGKKVFGFCAIASPDAFRRTLAELGASVCGFRAFNDHYQYIRQDISALIEAAEQFGAEWIVTTEKDIIKAGSLDLPDNVAVVRIIFEAEEGFFDKVFS